MNVLLIVIDTLRADHLGCYGYYRNTSPTIDRIAKEGIVFNNFYASGVCTGPGFTSIITGLYPINTEYYITPWNIPNTYQLDDNIPVLAEIMVDNGFTTIAFDDLINFRSHPKHFVRGYEYYINAIRTSKWRHHHLIAGEVNLRLIPWLKSHRYDNFFMFVHYWDPHMPYNQPTGYRDIFRHKSIDDLKVCEAKAGYKYVPGWGRVEEIFRGDENKSIDLYDGEIFYVDHSLAEIFSTLYELDLMDDTLIIITSDHGEQLGQHGVYGHAGLHESVIKIPLIIRYPDKFKENIRIDRYAQHVDIVPTILDLANIKYERNFDGYSIRRIIDGSIDREYIVCETWGERAIVSGEWKLIVHYEKELNNPREVIKPILKKTVMYRGLGIELYNIVKDPMEIVNLAENETSIVEKLLAKLNSWIDDKLKGRVDPMNLLDRYISPQPIKYQKI